MILYVALAEKVLRLNKANNKYISDFKFYIISKYEICHYRLLLANYLLGCKKNIIWKKLIDYSSLWIIKIGFKVLMFDDSFFKIAFHSG